MEQKMPRSVFIVICCICYFILFLILKGFIVFVQDYFMDNGVYSKSYMSGDILNIVSNKNIDDYFSNQSGKFKIKVVNEFQGFELDEHDDYYETYLLYDEGEIKAVFTMGVYNTQLYNINNYEEDSYYYEFNHFPLYISNIFRNKVLNEHNIENDVDLVKYLREREKIKCNIFTPIKKIKENYFFNYVELSLPSLDNITYFDGDLDGYMLAGDNYKRAFIFQNDKLYCLTFHKLDYFTDDMIKRILESVVIV